MSEKEIKNCRKDCDYYSLRLDICYKNNLHPWDKINSNGIGMRRGEKPSSLEAIESLPVPDWCPTVLWSEKELSKIQCLKDSVWNRWEKYVTRMCIGCKVSVLCRTEGCKETR